MNTGHGHVFPREDGVVARCGGPGLCAECSTEVVRRGLPSGVTRYTQDLQKAFEDGRKAGLEEAIAICEREASSEEKWADSYSKGKSSEAEILFRDANISARKSLELSAMLRALIGEKK